MNTEQTVLGGVAEPGTEKQILVGELSGVFRDNGRRMVLTAVLSYSDGERVITVPPGFMTDFSSIPRGLWNVFPPWQFPQAGVVHDFLYAFGGVTRGEADQIYLRILEALGCGWFKRRAAYLALRTCGWAVWRRYREAERDDAAKY